MSDKPPPVFHAGDHVEWNTTDNVWVPGTVTYVDFDGKHANQAHPDFELFMQHSGEFDAGDVTE